MAIDLLIFAVLVISFFINLLALGAFWVTPGLRTTANRFTINLLIINLVGCLILAPTLFLSADFFDGNLNSTSSLQLSSDDSIEFYGKTGNHQMTIRRNGHVVEREGIILQHRNVSENKTFEKNSTMHTIETIYKCNATYCRELTIDENSETVVIREIEETNSPSKNTVDYEGKRHHARHPQLSHFNMRPWCIDMAAALSAMAVLLVVGDTWCAVTDPLRYQSRISGLKTSVLIALTWAIGLFFGTLSAFREIDFESDTILSKQKRYALETHTFYALTSANNIFSIIFACLYFLIIILLPFGIVCGMYWRIFSEARGNGLRMRQNGSSPLLQSALNLHHSQGQSSLQQYANSVCTQRNSISSNSSQGGGVPCGLQMKIDQTKRSSPTACPRRDSAKVLLPPISDDGLSDENDMCSADNIKQQQHIILTLQAASGEIKRNYSVRQLELLTPTSQDFKGQTQVSGIRQVHSTPNLQRSINLAQVEEEEMGSPHLLGGHLPHHITALPISRRHIFQSNRVQHTLYHSHSQPQQHHSHSHHHLHHHHHHHHVPILSRHSCLQIPAIQAASPKAAGYMTSLKHRLSNASSLFKYREESRAARISILVVIMFLVSYLPYGFLVLLQSRIPSANFAHSSQLAIFMILLANLSSPFIFAYRNKRVRRGVQRLLHFDWRRHNSARSRQQQQQNCFANSKHCTNLKRNSSRMSNYSTNCGRYLTPQSSINSPVMGRPSHNNNGSLKKNHSCSTIINFSLSKNCHSLEAQPSEEEVTTTQHLDSTTVAAVTTPQRLRPVLQRGITIIEQQQPSGNDRVNIKKKPVKYKLFGWLYGNSTNKGCSATTSCHMYTGDSLDVEPAEV